MNKKSIFICYSSDALKQAEEIAHSVKGDRYEVFFDEFSLKAGDNVDATIFDRIDRSDLAIIVIDTTFSSKNYPQAEMELLACKPIIPVIIPPATEKDLPSPLRGTKALFWRRGEGLKLQEALEQLHDKLSKAPADGRQTPMMLALGLGLTILLAAATIGLSTAPPDSAPTGTDGSLPPVHDDMGTDSRERADSPRSDPDVPRQFPSSCRQNADCGAEARCVKKSTTRRLSPKSVVKKIDRGSFSDMIGYRCPEGSKRVGRPRGTVTKGGRCEVQWRTSDRGNCEVNVDVFGPAFENVECSVVVTVQDMKAVAGRCMGTIP